MQPDVEVDNLCFSYGNQTVLKQVSFSIQKGQFIGVIGPNGGGKTTLLKLLLGFLKPQSGTIRIFGKTPQQARLQMAYMPQNLRFDSQFPITVLEIVLGGRLASSSLFGGYTKEDVKAALSAIDSVCLNDFIHASFGSLSGGQAQRALLARALVSKPQILLLDEPTASVDAQAEKIIFDLLHSLVGKVTLVMVTHKLQAITKNVTKVFCIQQTLSYLKPEEVCSHFSLGLYHPGKP